MCRTRGTTNPGSTSETARRIIRDAGVAVSSTISVSATASDNVGVMGVQFLLDGVNLGTKFILAPCATTWDTASASNGTHVLTAVARDAAGNHSTGAAV